MSMESPGTHARRDRGTETATMTPTHRSLTPDDVLDEIERDAKELGLSAPDAFRALDAGKLAAVPLGAELHVLRHALTSAQISKLRKKMKAELKGGDTSIRLANRLAVLDFLQTRV